MADHHKALANALRNLKGIHSSGGKKAPVVEKLNVVEAAVDEDFPLPPAKEAETVPEPSSRKRKQMSPRPSSGAPANEETEVADSVRSPRDKYCAAIERMPRPRHFTEMEAAGYETITYSFL